MRFLIVIPDSQSTQIQSIKLSHQENTVRRAQRDALMTPGVVVPRVSVMVQETVMMAPTKIHYFAEV